MQVKYISFFDYQKTSNVVNISKPDFFDVPIISPNANSITSKSLINCLTNPRSSTDINYYHDVLCFINNSKRQIKVTQHSIDSFAVYFSIIFGFKIASAITLDRTIVGYLQRDFAFFRYYNKAFMSIANSFMNNLSLNKYTRIDYL